MPAIYHEGSWLGNATDPEVLVKDTVGWTGKNRAYSQTNNAVIAHIENGITYDVSWTGSATVTLKKNSASGATITSGSTSPLSFTADADYELYFGSSATVTNIMVKDSRITDPTYEPYHESVEEEIEQIYADNGVLGAKNLLKNVGSTVTQSGITATYNSDGSILLNGTATANIGLVVSKDVSNNNFLPNGKYILSGSAVFSDNCYLWMNKYVSGSGSTLVQLRTSGEVEFAIDTSQYDGIKVGISIRNGTTLSNFLIKPMIRLASDPDDTYQPYAMTNREITGALNNVIPWTVDRTGATNASDVISDSYYIKTGRLVHFMLSVKLSSQVDFSTYPSGYYIGKVPIQPFNTFQPISVYLSGNANVLVGFIQPDKEFGIKCTATIPANTIVRISGTYICQ